ncbi:hypothetical protein HWV62_24075 [Athelia sp. TMB]|nr:hypothetical protein HWV62_24075 [Athelia sp. TMB]
MIAHLALADEDPANIADLHYIATSQRLVLNFSQVCSVWRAAVINDATLWVFWSCSPSNRSLLYYHHIILSRSKHHPLRAQIRIWKIRDLNAVSALGDILAGHVHGLQSLEVKIWPQNTNTFALLFPSPSVFEQPQLKVLSIQHAGQQHDTTLETLLDQSPFSSLHHLKVHGVDSLQLNNFWNLKSLVLSSGGQKKNKIWIFDVLEALQGLHRLEALSFIGTPIRFPGTAAAGFYMLFLPSNSLPSLRQLSITGLRKGEDYVEQLLQALLPRISRNVDGLELELGKELGNFVKLLQHAGTIPQFRSMTLRIARPHDSHIHQFLRLLPAFEPTNLIASPSSTTLSFKFGPRSPQEQSKMPSLQTLDLVFEKDIFLHMFLLAAMTKPGGSSLRVVEIHIEQRDLERMEGFCDLLPVGAKGGCGGKSTRHGHLKLPGKHGERLCMFLHQFPGKK